MAISKTILVLLSLAAISECTFTAIGDDDSKISLKELVSLPIKFSLRGGLYYDTVGIVVGARSSDMGVGTNVDMVPDLSHNTILVGSYPELNWGISCDNTNSCSKQQANPETCKRLGASASCLPITTYFRYHNQSMTSKVAQLPAYLMTTQDSWSPKGAGVLGLGPKSPLWSYFRLQYDTDKEYVDVSLFYRANNLDKITSIDNSNYQNAVFVVNGKGIAVDPFFMDLEKTDNKSWIINSINFTKKIDGNVVETNEKVCLANSINATFATNQMGDIKRSVYTQLCGKPDGCHKSESNMEGVYKWTFILYNNTDKDSRFRIDIKPQEFITFDSNGRAVLLVEDLSNPQYSDICQGATLAFGKYFFAAREVVLRYNKRGDSFMIGFHGFEPSLTFLIILLCLAGLIFITFVGVCFYTILNKIKAQGQHSTGFDDHTGARRNLVQSGAEN